jgi:hypothetical protein
MPYIGRDTDKLSNVEVLDNITFDGSSSYTLQKGGSNFTPSSANTLLLSIDGVVQAGNFTVSGSTIDFGTAVAGTSTCDFVLHYGVGLITAPSDGTVTTAKLADSSVSLAKLTATGTKDATTFLRGDNTFAEAGGGIEEADMWRLTTDITANVDPIASNLERVDDASFAKIGTGMTVSSGIWSFPVTGLYQVTATATMASNGDDNVSINIFATLNNSSYDELAKSWSGTDGGGAAGTNTGTAVAFVNVTDVSNVKVKFTVGSVGSGSSVLSGTDVTYTGFNFIRLGDSQ